MPITEVDWIGYCKKVKEIDISCWEIQDIIIGGIYLKSTILFLPNNFTKIDIHPPLLKCSLLLS